MHQQCWLWGRDIRRPEGNLLIAHGFSRVANDQGIGRRYSRDDGRARLHLWGFGAAWVPKARAGAFVGRYGFAPMLISAVPPYALAFDDLVLAHPRSDSELLAASQSLVALCDWITHYERWVADAAGGAYRKAALSWGQAVSGADEIVMHWQNVTNEIRAAVQEITAAPEPGGI